MNITPVIDVLGPRGFAAPALSALVPNETNYRVLLMQPQGQIEAGPEGVRNRDRDLALRQFGGFISQARSTNADLVISPEYSMPWETLVSAITEGRVPAEGKLWALGCESLRYKDLEAVKEQLAPMAEVVYEELHPDPERFLDPLAYVFLARRVDNAQSKVVILVQFKTYPMGDREHFETNGMQRGTRIYQFGDVGHSLRLVSLICSDALVFLDADALAVFDRTLLLHIQLNPKPRQEQFRLYRDRLLRFQGDETELICLNWARDVEQWDGENSTCWHNISGSAWYLKPDTFDDRDETLNANHRRGLYYTWLKPLYSHALFFNYRPGVFLLEATKVAHIGVAAPVSRRRGPQLTRIFSWNQETRAWAEELTVDDGFSGISEASADAEGQIAMLANASPLAAERVLALCAGRIGKVGDWPKLHLLDSCVIDSSEIIYRITFSQDTDDAARDFRIARLRRCGNLWNILTTPDLLPPALSDFAQGFRFEWSSEQPHQNAISSIGNRATVIYMGEESSPARVEETAMIAAEKLRRAFSDPDANLSARQRLAIWFRENNQIEIFDSSRYVNYDQTNTESEFDIGREK
jgi:hypothetical protein